MTVIVTKDGLSHPFTTIAVAIDSQPVDLANADVRVDMRTPIVIPPPPIPIPIPIPIPGHPDDPIKEKEHQQVMNLLPRSEANGDNRILIEPGLELIHGGERSYDWIRVEGLLRISQGILRVGTIVCVPGSRIEINGGIIDFFGEVTDLNALGIGLLSHGTCIIDGNPIFRTAFGSLSRGHVMLMHNPNIEIKGTPRFENLGRTRQDIAVTDPDGLGGGLANPRGRYPLHLHRIGFTIPVLVSGATVVDPLSWGIVIHESNAKVEDTVVINAFGASYVTETGNELGWFKRNKSLTCRGRHRTNQANSSMGQAGHGFWMESRNVLIDSNYVEDTDGEGIFINSSSLSGTVPFKVINNTVDQTKGPINKLNGGGALTIWSVGSIPAGIVDATQSLVANNVFKGRIGLGYTGHIDFINNQIIGWGPVHSNFIDNSSGVSHSGVNFDCRWINNTITGWEIGAYLGTEQWHVWLGGFYDNLKTNLKIQNPQQNFFRDITIDGATFGNLAKWNIEMMPDFFHYAFGAAYKDYPNPYVQAPLLEMTTVGLWKPTGLGARSTVKVNGIKLFFDVQGSEFPWSLLKYTEYQFKKTSDWIAEGKIPTGTPLPEGTQYQVPKIRGVFVE